MNEEYLEERMDAPDELDMFIKDNAQFFADFSEDYKKYKMAYLMLKNGLTAEELTAKNDDSKK